MRIKSWATLASFSILAAGMGGLVTSCANPCAASPGAGAKTEDVNPCAAKENPCAAKENPCAAKENPCAAKENPCAGT